MPRKAKKSPPAVLPYNTGDATQAPAGQTPMAPTGMPYGAHQASIQSQSMLPVVSDPGVQLPAPSAAPADPLAGALAMMPPGPGLLAPTDRPLEPVTHGLPVGPGAGPEILPPPVPNVSVAYDAIYKATGNPLYRMLADQTRPGVQ